MILLASLAQTILKTLIVRNTAIKPSVNFLENMDQYCDSAVFSFLKRMPKVSFECWFSSVELQKDRVKNGPMEH